MKLRGIMKEMQPSIYEHDNKTFVAFGRGTIQMGVATDDAGQVMIHLADVMRENTVGLDVAKWEGAKGRTVVLGFDQPESLRVLLRTVQDALDAFAKPTPPEEPQGGGGG